MLRPQLLLLTAAASFCALAASCKVGPNYRRPELNTGVAYKSATTQEAAAPHLEPLWWELFKDPDLNKLEEAAIISNPDLQAAMARVVEARAAARIVKGQFFPIINAGPSVSWSRPSPNQTSATGSKSGTVTTTQIPFDLSYEVDIWGRVRRSYEAAVATVQASADDYDVVLQTLEADLAQNYFTLRLLDAQAVLLDETVDSYRKQVDLTHKQTAAGIGTPTDEWQAQALLNSTVAQTIDIRRQRADIEHAIAIQIGRPPVELTLAPKPLDITPPAVPAGLPADLLRRRPDIAEAEQNLIAANAQIGAATAQLYPTLTLNGLAGFQSLDTSHALDWQQRIWSFGPSLTIPIFEGGRLEANVAQTKARFDELLANYRSRVLSAIRDVEDSLNDLHMRAEQGKAQDQAVAAAREYLRLAQLQYQAGKVSYLQVVDAERTLLGNELTAVQIRNQRLLSTVLLIKAIGGGWRGEAPPTTQP